MSEPAHEVPLEEASGHLAEVVGEANRGNRIVYLTEGGERVAAVVPADDAWHRSPGWQAALAEADNDLRAGRYRDFDSMDELFDEAEEFARANEER